MLTRRLDLLVNYCQARSLLCGELKARLPDEGACLSEVALHSLFDLFEFFYALASAEIKSEDAVANLLKGHNAECDRLYALSSAQLDALDLNKQRVKDAKFTEFNIRKLSDNLLHISAIDQSDIGRLLFKHMSRETCRKALQIFVQAELVNKIYAGNAALIRSNGQAEDLFEQYLIRLASPGAGGSREESETKYLTGEK